MVSRFQALLLTYIVVAIIGFIIAALGVPTYGAITFVMVVSLLVVIETYRRKSSANGH